MFKKLFILLTAALVFSGCTLPSFVQKKSGLKVNIANAEATSITLNGLDLGQAPFESNDLKPGSYTLKLTPQNSARPTYETSITLNSGLLTVVTWSFGATAEESGGEIFELSKSSGGKTELSVVTNPDNIIVKVDGQSKGFSPLTLDDLSPGSHQLTLTSPGYVERTSNPSLLKGYRVTVTSKLGREPETAVPTTQATDSAALAVAPSPSPRTTTASPKPSPKPSPKASPSASATPAASQSGVITTTTTPPLPYAQVNSAQLGYVNVRATAEQNGTLLAKLGDGSKVPYIDKTDNGWLKVEYQTGKQGWISATYATVHSQ